MLKILKYIKPKEWAMVAVGFLFIVLQVGLDLLLPDFMSEITTMIQTPGSTMGAVMATERSGLTISEAEKVEESITGSLLHSLFAFSQISSGNTNTLTNAQILGIAESQVIQQLALGGAAVYIGRGAMAFLGNYGPVLKVFIRAELDERLYRAEHVYGYSSGEAEKVIRKYDKRRSASMIRGDPLIIKPVWEAIGVPWRTTT